MAPVTQYVFAEPLRISECFTAGSHEWLPYSAIPPFPKQIYKHQFVALPRMFNCRGRDLCNIVTDPMAKTGYTKDTFQAKENNTMSVITITKDNFEQEVLSSDKPVLLDFWASWCGPCRMVSPIVDEIAEERTDIKVGKVNVDEQSELAARFRVMSIPTLVVMKNGEIVNQSVGARPKAQILAML